MGVPLVGMVRKGSVGLGEKLPQWKETGKGTEAGKSSVWVSEQQGQREKGHAKEDSPGQVPRDVGCLGYGLTQAVGRDPGARGSCPMPRPKMTGVQERTEEDWGQVACSKAASSCHLTAGTSWRQPDLCWGQTRAGGLPRAGNQEASMRPDEVVYLGSALARKSTSLTGVLAATQTCRGM